MKTCEMQCRNFLPKNKNVCFKIILKKKESRHKETGTPVNRITGILRFLTSMPQANSLHPGT